MLHNYQLQVSQFVSSSSMVVVDKNESAQQSFMKFKHNEGFIKINDNTNTQVASTTLGVAPLSKYFRKELTPLFEFLHSIMLRLMNANVLQLPPIKPIDPCKPLPALHDPKAFFQYISSTRLQH